MKVLIVYLFILVGLACCGHLGKSLLKFSNENIGLGIVNGKPVPITEYPYMVAFRIDTMLSAAGVLLNDRWILTTVDNTEVIRFLDIYVGNNKMGKGQQVGVDKVVVHPKYEGNWEYNAALVKIVMPVKFSKKVNAIAMGTDKLAAGTVGSSAGWGVTEENDDSQVLRAANNSVLDDNSCAKAYGSWFNKKIFCSKVEKTGPCTDDYGAPFVVNNKMYGMFVGFLYDCTANPRVYVKMSSIADWVNETISEK